MTFVSPINAFQHLTARFPKNLANTVTLCGRGMEDIYEPVVYEHKQGFDPNGGPACARCADAADRLQNGPRE